MLPRASLRLVLFSFAFVGIAGCNSNNGPSGPADYNPVIPTSWSPAVTNPFFPLAPGTTYQYEGQTSEGTETITVEVLADTKVIQGVTAVVVRDRVYLDGELIEDTVDWYAQDAEGNVWYLGEETKELVGGQVVSTEGSWEWGVDGALPGIIMWVDPAAHVGAEYRQEYYEDEAEDWGKVIATNESVSVPHGNFTQCIKTEEWNALEPGPRENKFYAPQIGFALEITPSGERVELVSITTR
jgi:hypothetical protein